MERHDYQAPDPYADGLERLRAAQSADTPEQTFEQDYQLARLDALIDEYERMGIKPIRFTAAEELKRYSPPDPYAPGLAALRAQKG